MHHQRLQEGRQQLDRDEQHADPEHQPGFGHVHARRCREGLAPRTTARQPKRRDGAPRGSREGVEEQQRQCRQQQRELQGTVDELHQRPRAVADRPAEEVGRRGPEHAAGGDGEALVAPALRPRDRLRPLRLQVRPGRAVEERRLELAPAALEVDPRELGSGLSRIARDRRDRRAELVVRTGRVVAADALLCRAPEEQPRVEEVRVRAGRRVDDRVGAVDELELVVAPGRLLRSLVLAVADLAGCFASASAALPASKSSWIISQSPSCRLFQSL